MVKECFKCKNVYDLSFFNKSTKSKDGHINKCKSCLKQYYKEYDLKRNKSEHRKLQKNEQRKDSSYRLLMRKSRLKYKMNNPIKAKVHRIVTDAIKTRKLIKKPCEVCGVNKRVHAHHEDYNKPLDVIFLCPKHHAERHKELKNNGK